ncbi:HhoA/HhoB/HtrA family serine endopeptidase [Thermosynechococcus sp. QKsg1]|uniref:HhoA/HhoB/HtrA family serine endopeptidase n=2 Tax=unclassified Thermosynechococcus TaxID=2622553 RepID=UPI0025770F80|nr:MULTISPECIES: HhoA/HhoB/HtrA family serine endopeptidase [unclassified Thermosynechococcus]WJI24018.1 trypsin-like peptidase domain-containing protein [Thermosynechococcus sp. B0]WKT83650.1 HhoA/HhoB/HtrA family serine endopeptidase [Thermosynechococcus sp. HY596]WNC62781.1 HhoA/HhoB/HtrA family serine endopeptidase [Thermosynechococcus sp. HY591]WNC86652.1 HhoA/HhoB/HtrA family serine endopeptidase [Thermosynechococcus sp. QKsg1]
MNLLRFRPPMMKRLAHLLQQTLKCCLGLALVWCLSSGTPVWAAAAHHSFVAAAVERVGDAVVRIDTERTIVRPADPLLSDPFFRQFFPGLALPPQEDRLRGQGSGFIIDPSGIVMTNAHVVSQADTVTVRLKDGRVFEGEVRGVDEVSDLAIVKLKGVTEPLPTAPLGDSSDVKVGDWAIAVGNPLGLDNTVTLGIVSTLHRSSAQVGIPDKRLDFIQTDAAINPGNSGGPLLNEEGEVIGINTAIRADAMGIGFAIPINKAKALQERLIRGEKIQHAYIGIQMTTFTPAMAKENNANPNSPVILPEVNGVLVLQVLPNTPAAKAGLRWGDVITAVDGEPITSADQLQGIVDSAAVGQVLNLTVQRGDRSQRIAVRTAELQGAA